MRSPRINQLSQCGELFFRRLMSVVDDYGRTEAHPTLLRSSCYPLLIDKVTEDDVSAHLVECEQLSLLTTYMIEEKAFLEVTNFNQQIRAKQSKFPGPPKDAQHMRSTCIADAQHVHSTRIADATHVHSINNQENAKTPVKQQKTKDAQHVHSICVADAQHMIADAHLGGGGGGDEDGGGVGGGEATNQPDQPPPLSFFLETFSKWDEAKVREVFDSFERGNWMWGKNPVKDYVEAFQLRLADRIKQTLENNPIGGVLASLESAMNQSAQTQGNNGSYSNGKKPFISELKEKRRVYQDQYDELRARGNHYATGFEYESKADRLQAIELKKKMKQVDQEILDS